MKNDYSSRKLLYKIDSEGEEFSVVIKKALFTSVWDDGYKISTTCQVNMITKEVFDIEIACIRETEILDILEREYVTIDGKDYTVSNVKSETEYWYS